MKHIENIRERINGLSKRILFGFSTGIAIYALAANEYFAPTNTHSGRWAWLFNWATEIFGTNGSMYLYIAIGTLLIAFTLMDNKDND